MHRVAVGSSPAATGPGPLWLRCVAAGAAAAGAVLLDSPAPLVASKEPRSRGGSYHLPGNHWDPERPAAKFDGSE